MPKFNVIIKEIEIYEIEVEAENEEEASDKAWEKLDCGVEEKCAYYSGSDGETEVTEL